MTTLNIINYTKLGQSTKQRQAEETRLYRLHLLDSGMEEISKEELLEKLTALNYKIDEQMCLSYYNDLNELKYLARSMSYIDKKTQKSFAHFEQRNCNHENLDKLQKLRRHYFVFENGRIWDL